MVPKPVVSLDEKDASMTEEKNRLATLFADCWKDEALKARFMRDPALVLAEYGMPVPAGVDVKVVENEADCVHITMPAAPLGHEQLSDEDLQHAAGGCDPGMQSFNTTVSPNRTCHAC